MKKKILLIGNTDGLPGVKVDCENYTTYFKSDQGGAWWSSEIIEKINPSLSEVVSTLNELKKMNLDYLIVIFSGHGGQKRETVLELNSRGELISESQLNNIGNRQLTIFDCCRTYSQEMAKASSTKVFNMLREHISSAREKFERRIMQASYQGVRLYSCSVGETSLDTGDGGIYSKHLIREATNDQSEYILVGRVHSSAAVKTTLENSNQHPDAILPKLLTEQQLIFGINP